MSPDRPKILIVDDDRRIRMLMREIFEDSGYAISEAGDGYEALEQLSSSSIDLAILDLKMPGVDGIQVLKKVQVMPTPPIIIVVTAHGTIKTAIESTRLGAYDFIEKPIEEERILHLVNKALEARNLQQENLELKNALYTEFEIIGSSAATAELRDFINKCAALDATVLLTGSNGTGKDLVARNIHLRSQRGSKPFVNINCAAIPENLIESELFGFERGTFTGADRKQIGKFEYAAGGTLFLNEIGEMSPQTQAKLLHVLENRSFTRLGSHQEIQTDVRVIAATNKNIDKAMEEGTFRTDLYYRLQMVYYTIADLKDRREDIIPLFNYFMQQFCDHNGLAVKELASDSISTLLNYDWPGNVRQLKNLAANLAITAKERLITPAMLSDALPHSSKQQELSPTEPDTSLRTARAQFEKEYIAKILEENGWNIRQSAAALDVERTHLYKLINKLDLQR